MSKVNFQVVSGRPDSYIESNFQTAGGNHAILNRIIQYLNSINAGNELAESSSAPPSVSSILLGSSGAVQASAYFTFASVVATNTFAINGVTFTGVASGATGNQFNIGADDAATVVNAAAAVNASVTALVAGYVTAAQDPDNTDHLVITAVAYGLSGNLNALTSGTNITRSAANLSGGIEDAGALTLSF